jgi:hypothetical protein
MKKKGIQNGQRYLENKHIWWAGNVAQYFPGIWEALAHFSV